MLLVFLEVHGIIFGSSGEKEKVTQVVCEIKIDESTSPVWERKR